MCWQVMLCFSLMLAVTTTQQLFEDVPHPPHVTNKSWFTYRPHNVAHHAHLRVHAVALLIDRDWHDQICEQGAAARLWFDYVGRACSHWHTVLKEPISEAVVLQAREVMRIIEDSWHNLYNMRGGRRDPAAEAFGERWESAGGHSAHDGAVLKIPEDGGIAFSHPSELLSFMWRTLLYAHVFVAERDDELRETASDTKAFEHTDASEACVEGAEDNAAYTPGELRESGALDYHDIDAVRPEDDERYRDREDIEYEDAERDLQYEADATFWLRGRQCMVVNGLEMEQGSSAWCRAAAGRGSQS